MSEEESPDRQILTIVFALFCFCLVVLVASGASGGIDIIGFGLFLAVGFFLLFVGLFFYGIYAGVRVFRQWWRLRHKKG